MSRASSAVVQEGKHPAASAVVSDGPNLPATVRNKHLLFVFIDDAPFFKNLGLFEHQGFTVSDAASSEFHYPDTPTIDSLASGGVVFTHVYACPICSPSRASWLTGMYPFRHGVGTVVRQDTAGDLYEFNDPGFLFPTVANKLDSAGIETGIFGKVHLSIPQLENFTTGDLRAGQGYDIVDRLGFKHRGIVLRNHSQQDDVVQDNPSYYKYGWHESSVGGGKVESLETTYSVTKQVDGAIDFLSTIPHGKRAFCYLPLNATHTPLNDENFPPEQLVNTQEFIDWRTPDESEGFAAYMGCTEAVDTELGRLLSTIPASVREALTVVVMADNGPLETAYVAARDDEFPQPQDYGTDWHTLQDSGRMKGTVYQWGTNVPIIWNGPREATESVAMPARTSKVLIGIQDLFPTFLEYFGVTPPASDGVSFLTEAWEGTSTHTTHGRTDVMVEKFNPCGDIDDLTDFPGGDVYDLRLTKVLFEADGFQPGTYSLVKLQNDDEEQDYLYRQWDGTDAVVDVDRHELTALDIVTAYRSEYLEMLRRLDEIHEESVSTGDSLPLLSADGLTTYDVILNSNGDVPLFDSVGNEKYVDADVDRVHLALADEVPGTGDAYVLLGVSGSDWQLPLNASAGQASLFVRLNSDDTLPLYLANETPGSTTPANYVISEDTTHSGNPPEIGLHKADDTLGSPTYHVDLEAKP